MGRQSSRGSLKPRNGHVQAALFRKAGAHGLSRKAERQARRIALQGRLRSGKMHDMDDRPERALGPLRPVIRNVPVSEYSMPSWWNW
ncbi:hypothetical protein ACEUZ9_001022 [Paracoccus litorisediminis]|uniref:hypothetical protein n=1 Tax=Paracoccus litorisediminis TaxID=2006130 RepID=UPI00372FC1B1